MALAGILEHVADWLALLVELGVILALAVHLHVVWILLDIAWQLVGVVELVVVIIGALGSYGHACLPFGEIRLEQLCQGVLGELQAGLEEAEVDHAHGIVGTADDLDATLDERRRIACIVLEEQLVQAHVILGEVPLVNYGRVLTGIINFLGPHSDGRDTSLEQQTEGLEIIALHTVLADGYPRGIGDKGRSHLAQTLQVGSIGHAVDQHHGLVVEKLQEVTIVGGKDAGLIATAQLTRLVDAIQSWLHHLQRLELLGFPVTVQPVHLALDDLGIGVET